MARLATCPHGEVNACLSFWRDGGRRGGASLWYELPVARDHAGTRRPFPTLQVRDIRSRDFEPFAHLTLSQARIKPRAFHLLRRRDDPRPAVGTMRQRDCMA